jgi:hypothetical protein
VLVREATTGLRAERRDLRAAVHSPATKTG